MEITENELIRRLARFGKRAPRILRGIGDDGAVVAMEEGAYVFVQDVIVEHIHFEFEYMDAFYVGKKAVYVNVSDVLSMGGLPLYFLASIGIPGNISYRDIRRLYRGMNRASGEFNVLLLGGDTTATMGPFFIDISMVGKLITTEYFGRNKAQPGDLIAVTGRLGESAYGLELLKEGAKRAGGNPFIERYRNPRPPYTVWKELTKDGITTAMMDISDGLIIDLERMMQESGTGAEIHLESVPMPPLLRRKGKEAHALSGGEDYQFLFSFSREKSAAIEDVIKRGFSVTVIGQVVRGRGVSLFSQGKRIIPQAKGYQHFGTTS